MAQSKTSLWVSLYAEACEARVPVMEPGLGAVAGMVKIKGSTEAGAALDCRCEDRGNRM